ncbi:MAG: sugar ABC transporter permease, partial [Candidatus Atribacteria bacterium]|nr:sugar ABC transporter permease [Candidatus Atribacteria bacterium]
LLAKLRKAFAIWRTLLFLPTVIPIVSVAIAWKLLFHYDGLVNNFLSIFNIGPIPWLTSTTYARSALIITSWWHATSYYMILFLSGILAIPSVYMEAAEIDGAKGWQCLKYITLPLIRPTMVLVFVISIINGFKTFALQKIMTNGGPATATEITTLHIYKTAFNFGLYGEAAALSFLYFLIILGFSLIQLRVFKGGE